MALSYRIVPMTARPLAISLSVRVILRIVRSTSLSGRLSRLSASLPRPANGTVEAVAAAVVALIPVSVFNQYSQDRMGFVLELLLCAAAATVGRWPAFGSLATGVIMTTLLLAPLDRPRPTLFVVLVVIASLGAHGYRSLRLGMSVWFLAIQFVLENSPPQPAEVAVSSTIVVVMLVAAAWAIGEAIHRIAAERARGTVDRTAAVQAQRRTIARDLHDTIAYSTTSIILRAEQAKLRGVRDPQVEADLDYIINAGRNSMRDLRGMMETLRRNEPDTAGSPHSPWQISSLTEVIDSRTDELRQHGFAVSTHVDADARALPESVRETLGKVVVEATGNMVKHGDPSGPVSIMIESSEDDVEAVFINRPKPAGSARRYTAQLGLVGARERVEALGGEIHVTSQAPDWVVRVLIPLGG